MRSLYFLGAALRPLAERGDGAGGLHLGISDSRAEWGRDSPGDPASAVEATQLSRGGQQPINPCDRGPVHPSLGLGFPIHPPRR